MAKPEEKISSISLKKRYDRHAADVLQDFLIELLREGKGPRWYKIKKALPSTHDYDTLREAKYSKTITEALDDANSEVDSLRDEMSEWRDNMEEKFSSTSKYEDVSSVADELDNLNLPDTEGLPDIRVVLLPGEGNSRAHRASDAAATYNLVAEKLDEFIDKMTTEDKDSLEELVSTIQEAASALENISFPGMF